MYQHLEYRYWWLLYLYGLSHSINVSAPRIQILLTIISLTWSLLIQGMAYLASMRVIHCDLAGRNVLLTNALVAKITDFGLAKILQADKDYYTRSSGKELPLMWLVNLGDFRTSSNSINKVHYFYLHIAVLFICLFVCASIHFIHLFIFPSIKLKGTCFV
jgi:serine/threonine protein kinase